LKTIATEENFCAGDVERNRLRANLVVKGWS